jgi:PPOX class probable F420-dependent enzyme
VSATQEPATAKSLIGRQYGVGLRIGPSLRGRDGEFPASSATFACLMPQWENRFVRKGLKPEDLGDLLEVARVAVLATYRRDGSVLLSPVWHEWRDDGFNVMTGSTDVKAGHLRRDPRASIVVYEDAPPYRGLELRAEARLSVPDDRAIIRRIATRYLGAEAGERYATGGGDDLLIRLEPGELRAWDFTDDFA